MQQQSFLKKMRAHLEQNLLNIYRREVLFRKEAAEENKTRFTTDILFPYILGLWR
jgi:hypothetical protein